MSEPMIRLLAQLPSAQPDSVRAERIRMRCRARLARQALPTSAPGARSRRGRAAELLWQPLIAILGVAYLADVILQAVRVFGGP